MNFARVKTILIFLFIFVNIFLLVTLYIQNQNYVTIKKETVDDTVFLLKKSGIEIDSSIINRKTTEVNILDVEKAFELNEAFIKNILGNDYIKQDNIYKSSIGELYALKGILHIKYYNKINISDQKDAIKQAQEFLKKINFFNKYTQIKDVNKKDESYYISFYQKYLEKEFFDISADFTLSKDGILSFEARWLSKNIMPSKPVLARHITSVLIDFINNTNRGTNIKIIDIKNGYYINNDDYELDYKKIQAIPCYKILTSDNKAFYYDARNGFNLYNTN